MVIGILSAVMSVGVHQRAHGLGELRARHPPALHAAGHAARGDAAGRHAGVVGCGTAWVCCWPGRCATSSTSSSSASRSTRPACSCRRSRRFGPAAISASAAFWSTTASLVTVIGWRIAADAGAGGVFAIDPLWPGLAVSALLLLALIGPRRGEDRFRRDAGSGGPRPVHRAARAAGRRAIETFTYRGDADALAAACRGAAAILTDYVPFDRAVLGRLERCRIISVAATGWDCVDAAAAAERGIAVASVGEYCTDEVADHTLALLLALERQAARLRPPGAVRAAAGAGTSAGDRAPRRPHAGPRRLRPHRPGGLPPRARLRPRSSSPAIRGWTRRRSAPRRRACELRGRARARGHPEPAQQPRRRQPGAARPRRLRQDAAPARAPQRRARGPRRRGRPGRGARRGASSGARPSTCWLRIRPTSGIIRWSAAATCS